MKNAVMSKEETKKNDLQAHKPEFPVFYSLQQEMNRLFDEFRQGLGFAQPKWIETFSDFRTKVDIKEADKSLVVTAELPGVDMKDISLSISPEGLVIKGEKRQEKEEKEEGYYRMERSYGSFHRVIPLSLEVDQDNIDATYKDGVLKVVLPKTKQAQANEKNIAVKAG